MLPEPLPYQPVVISAIITVGAELVDELLIDELTLLTEAGVLLIDELTLLTEAGVLLIDKLTLLAEAGTLLIVELVVVSELLLIDVTEELLTKTELELLLVETGWLLAFELDFDPPPPPLPPHAVSARLITKSGSIF